MRRRGKAGVRTVPAVFGRDPQPRFTGSASGALPAVGC